MKRIYEKPEMEITSFNLTDSITDITISAAAPSSVIYNAENSKVFSIKDL